MLLSKNGVTLNFELLLCRVEILRTSNDADVMAHSVDADRQSYTRKKFILPQPNLSLGDFTVKILKTGDQKNGYYYPKVLTGRSLY